MYDAAGQQIISARQQEELAMFKSYYKYVAGSVCCPIIDRNDINTTQELQILAWVL